MYKLVIPQVSNFMSVVKSTVSDCPSIRDDYVITIVNSHFRCPLSKGMSVRDVRIKN